MPSGACKSSIFAPMDTGRIILEKGRFLLTIERLCRQLIERYDNCSDLCLVGIQPRGVPLAERIHQGLIALGATPWAFGRLDITFYRDDFRTRQKPLKASPTDMDFLVEGKNVVLIDDVLYSGRTVQAALNALGHYGRPNQVSLLVLVDRRFNRHLPIQADYTGLTIDALDEAYVRVDWSELSGDDRILLFPHKPDED